MEISQEWISSALKCSNVRKTPQSRNFMCFLIRLWLSRKFHQTGENDSLRKIPKKGNLTMCDNYHDTFLLQTDRQTDRQTDIHTYLLTLFNVDNKHT